LGFVVSHVVRSPSYLKMQERAPLAGQGLREG